jgi:hypothetical protein
MIELQEKLMSSWKSGAAIAINALVSGEGRLLTKVPNWEKVGK